MSEAFQDVQDDIYESQCMIDDMDGKSDGQVFGVEEYTKVVLDDVEDFLTWIETLSAPEGMSKEHFDEFNLSLFIEVRDILFAFDGEDD